MKALLLVIIALLLFGNAAAEECVAERDSQHVEACAAGIDDVLRISAGGYVAQHYIAQYHGQRLAASRDGTGKHSAGLRQRARHRRGERR